MTTSGYAMVVGAGSGTGAAVAKLLAEAGWPVVLTRRDAGALQALAEEITGAGGRALPAAADAADEAAVTALFERAEQAFGRPALVVFATAGIASAPLIETEAAVLDELWQDTTRGGFLIAREAARRMLPAGQGSILFLGATASVKQAAGFSAFAAAKHGLRALAGSLARELGPQGIHVAHLIIDGIIDVPRVHERMPELAATKGAHGLIQPQHIAETLLWLHRQPRDAWTFELDLRPAVEPW
jgi:NAD(P)-dependent dehydrogenase (short-subunit alcohol dehydrogenase family)